MDLFEVNMDDKFKIKLHFQVIFKNLDKKNTTGSTTFNRFS